MPAARGPADGPGDRPGPRRASAPPPRGRRGRRSRSARWPAARSSPPSARRSIPATARWAPSVKWAGDWRRAYDYGDPQAEALAVHEAAGLIDVSTLGKLIVRGPEAGAFLDRLYPNRFSNLKPGRIRYGVISSDAGRIIDDGTICRLDDETLLRHDHLQRRRRGRAVVLLVAGRLAHAGARSPTSPRAWPPSTWPARGPARSWARLTDLDCSNEAFDYLDAKHAPVAGVRCLMLRIGFVGEVGYEIHFPAAYGQHVWDAILEAGAEHGLRPFGLEPQRILRLQKMHILVGQDTDSESTPLRRRDAVDRQARQGRRTSSASGRSSTYAERDADDSCARRLHAARRRRARPRARSCSTRDGEPVGQVTSARHSPPARPRRSAWPGCPPRWPATAPTITISDDSRTLRAEVHDQAVLRPRRRGAALVSALRVPRAGRAPPVARSPDGGPGARRRRADGGARRLERRRRLPRPRRPTPRSPGPTSRTCASCEVRGPTTTLTVRHRDADGRRVVVPGHARARAGDRRAPDVRGRASTSPPRSRR